MTSTTASATRCVELCLELTTRCHQNCIHCSTESTPLGERERQLSLHQAKSAVEWFAGQGGSTLQLSGGEPLYYPHLREIVSLARARGLRSIAYTTGLPSGGEPSIQELVSLGLSGCVFSLQGARREVHERITRVPGSFERTLGAIRDSVSLGIWTGVHFVPMRPNCTDMNAAAELALDLGVSEFAILRFVPQGRGADNARILELTDEQTHCMLVEVARLVARSPNFVRAGCPLNFCSIYEPSIEPKVCLAGRTTVMIDPRGGMYPCPAFKRTAAYMVKAKGDEWAAAWANQCWRELRSLRFQDIEGPCALCSRLAQCVGRCAAQRLMANGSVLAGPDPICPVADSRQELGHSHAAP